MAAIPKSILWVRGGSNDGATISLREGTTVLGRDPNNHVVVDEPGVSRQHAGIRGDRQGHWIEDLGSRNGTFVNGAQIEGEGRRLRNMDRIELGGNTSVHWVYRELGGTIEMRLPDIDNKPG